MAESLGPRLYSCSNCRNRVSLHDDIISKCFQSTLRKMKSLSSIARVYVVNRIRRNCLESGRNGRAFLFSHAMNITLGPKEDRHLLSGLHTVADIYCADCHQVLGWKYERAYEVSQKYKEGKFILEKAKIVNENW
ncbi:protein yippee-like [Gossypium australe]|uniref:Protein yippee-like n=1 Tax=Gossypium australe TaxID=47621 RepID=A0A5B6W2T9_9ROSI|nr:protein yippee-like [Gossypium australe]